MKHTIIKKGIIGIILLMCVTGVIIKLIAMTPPSATVKLVPTVIPQKQDYMMKKIFLGEYVCLPPKDTANPQTLECRLGLRLDDGGFVALDFGNKQVEIQTGERLELQGDFVPIEALSTDYWQKFPVSGILRVTSVKTLGRS